MDYIQGYKSTKLTLTNNERNDRKKYEHVLWYYGDSICIIMTRIVNELIMNNAN